MKIKFCEKVDSNTLIRNSQILLTFTIMECIRQTKIECSPRAKLITIIWTNVINLFKMIELHIMETFWENEHKWKEIEKNKETIHDNNIKKLNEEIKKSINETNQLNEQINKLKISLNIISEENIQMQNRINFLSSIISIFVSDNLNDLTEICEKKKLYIIQRLIELRKDRKKRNEKESDNDFSEELQRMFEYQYIKGNEIYPVCIIKEINKKVIPVLNRDIEKLLNQFEKIASIVKFGMNYFRFLDSD